MADIGVAAPAGIPPAVMKRLNDAIRKVMASPDVIDGSRKWRDVARKSNLKFE